jgi:ligand-binding sensor domain-containing protein/DNA-binding CsgD family transcriptional regulator/cbb3-type cytochrome oxidase subunit 3
MYFEQSLPMKIRWTLLLSWVLLLTVSNTHAQVYTFDQITIDDGLSNNTVFCILEDSEGFMWFGSRDGLNRFDGYEFKLFNIESEEIFSSNIQSLLCDDKGDIWTGLNNGGIAIFSKESQKFIINPFKDQENLNWSSLTIYSLFKDSKNNIWLGTLGNGVIRIDLNDNNKIHHLTENSSEQKRRIESTDCFAFVEDELGDIWIGTAGNNIHRYNYNNDSISVLNSSDYPGIDMASFRKSLLYYQGNIWIGTEGKGLFKYNLNDNQLIQMLDQNLLVRDIAIDGNENLIVSTDGSGLWISRDFGESFENLSSSQNNNPSFNTDALYDILIDSRKNIWVSSFNGGVNVHKPKKAKFYTFEQEIGMNQSSGINSVLSVNEDHKGNIWLGQDGGGITILDKELNLIDNIKNTDQNQDEICSNIITCQLKDSNGNIWMGTFSSGLISYNPKTKDFQCFVQDENDNESLNNNNVWALVEDNSEVIWVATLGGGLNKLDAKSKRFSYFEMDALGNRPLSGWNFQSLLIDSKNRLWAGSEFDGLYMSNRDNNNFAKFKFDPNNPNGLHSNSIRCIFEDSKKNIWIGTEGGGLHKLLDNKGEFENFSLEEGLPSKVINSIEEDEIGNLWISTNKGLSVYDPVESNFTNYFKKDGLLSNQFNARASFKDADGQMFFGCIRGLTSFKPNEIKPYKEIPSLAFVDFKVFDKSIYADDSLKNRILSEHLNDEPIIELNFRDKSFTIEYAALEYTYPNNLNYEYKLEGFQNEWEKGDAKKRSITYTNLNHGEYTFMVRPTNSGSTGQAIAKKLKIFIKAPFWKSWWFIALVSLFILFVLIGFYIYQIDKRKQEHQADMLKANQEILKLKNEKLGREIDQKSAQLSAALLQSAHKNNSLTEIKKKLNDLQRASSDFTGPDKKYVKSLVRKIDSELDSSDYWEMFQLNFNSVHQQYSQKLYNKHPYLSATELRLCSLIKLGMTNSEISSIQNISLSGVEKSKYRIKKKLLLSKEMDLNHYLITFN